MAKGLSDISDSKENLSAELLNKQKSLINTKEAVVKQCNRQPFRVVENNTSTVNVDDIATNFTSSVDDDVLNLKLSDINQDVESNDNSIEDWKKLAIEREYALKELVLENELMNETIFEMEKEINRLNRTIIALLPYKYSWQRLGKEYTNDFKDENDEIYRPLSLNVGPRIKEHLRNELEMLELQNHSNIHDL